MLFSNNTFWLKKFDGLNVTIGFMTHEGLVDNIFDQIDSTEILTVVNVG